MGIQVRLASLNGALTQHKNKNIKTLKSRQVIKLSRQHVPQALMFKMALKLEFKFNECLYLSNVSWKGVESLSAIYSEASLILNSFCGGRALQIMASGVKAMEKVRVPEFWK